VSQANCQTNGKENGEDTFPDSARWGEGTFPLSIHAQSQIKIDFDFM